MSWLLLAVLVVGLAAGAMAGGLALRAQRDREARLQVVPGVRSDAPRAWAGAHSPEARLHRRLGDAVRSMRSQPTLGGGVLTEQRTALEQEALRIDARLVAVAALTGAGRQPAIEAVAELVERYEAAVSDLVTASIGTTTASLDELIGEAEIKLRAIEEARAEVERIDRGERE